MRRIICRTTVLSLSLMRSDSSVSFKQRIRTTSSFRRNGVDGIIASSGVRSVIQPRISRQSRPGKHRRDFKPLLVSQHLLGGWRRRKNLPRYSASESNCLEYLQHEFLLRGREVLAPKTEPID